MSRKHNNNVIEKTKTDDRLPTQNENTGGGNGSWTTALHVLLPLAAFTLLWGRRGYITRFFLQFKQNCFSALSPSSNNQPELLKWIDNHLKYIWFSHLTVHGSKTIDYWKDGSLLCCLINVAIPGACSNPQKHWQRRPSHGQDLVHKYLGVIPIFTEDDLKNSQLSSKKEQHFFNYLTEVQKLVDDISKREVKYSSQYIARGMGLVTGEQYQNTVFYVYNNYSMATNKSDIVVSISGPYGTYCNSSIPTAYVKEKTEFQSLAYISRAQKMFFRSLSIDLGAIKLTDNKKVTYDNIPITIVHENERVKVMFVPQTEGVHEISIVSNGYHLVGSPFLSNILPPQAMNSTNRVDDATDNYSSKENYKRIKKTIISQIIDCIDEQISLFTMSDKDILRKQVPVQNQPEEESVSQVDCLGVTLNVHEDTEELTAQSPRPINDHDSESQELFGDVNLLPKSSLTEVSLEIEKKSLVSFTTSPICINHIEHEVSTLAQLNGKKILTRQQRVESDDDSLIETISDNDLNYHDVDTTFETLLETQGYYEKTDSYTDSYLTQLELQPEFLTKSSSCTVLFNTNKACLSKFEENSFRPIPRTRKTTIKSSIPNSPSNLTYRTQFKARQEYWKRRSSETLSCSSFNSDQNYLSPLYDTPRYTCNTAGSLPNLSDLRKAVFDNNNSRDKFFSDFYDSHESDSFREKFIQCRNFWETLSTQNLNISTEIISESDFDSGYYASLPNLSPDIDDGMKVSSQFKEKKQFWENLSLESSKWVKNQEIKKKYSKKSSYVVKPFLEPMITIRTNNTICEHDEEDILSENEETNVTDDLQEMNYIHYIQARNYFRNLEKS